MRVKAGKSGLGTRYDRVRWTLLLSMALLIATFSVIFLLSH